MRKQFDIIGLGHFCGANYASSRALSCHYISREKLTSNTQIAIVSFRGGAAEERRKGIESGALGPRQYKARLLTLRLRDA